MRVIKLSLIYWLVICVLLPVPAVAEIYKLVDQNGRTQYGDRPPSEKKDSQEIRLNPQQRSPSSENPPTSDWEDKDRAFRQRRIERQMQAEKEVSSHPAQDICRNARRKLHMLDGKVVYRVNEKGDRVYMEDAERSAIEQQARKDVASYCSNH